MKKFLLITSTVLSFLLVTQSCKSEVEEDVKPPIDNTNSCEAANAKFASFVSPLMSSKCATAGCHNANTEAAGINLQGFTNIKNTITARKAAFLGAIKHSPSFSKMPKGGTKLSDNDICKLELWINGGMPNN